MMRGAEQHLRSDGRHGSAVQGTLVVHLRTPDACSQQPWHHHGMMVVTMMATSPNKMMAMIL